MQYQITHNREIFMDNTYFIGDLVFTKTPMAMTSLIYVFNGAEKLDSGWAVYFTSIAAQGYAGGGSTIKFEVNVGDSLRLGDNCKGRVKNHLKPNKAGSDKKVNKIYFDKIEQDVLTASFDMV